MQLSPRLSLSCYTQRWLAMLPLHRRATMDMWRQLPQNQPQQEIQTAQQQTDPPEDVPERSSRNKQLWASNNGIPFIPSQLLSATDPHEVLRGLKVTVITDPDLAKNGQRRPPSSGHLSMSTQPTVSLGSRCVGACLRFSWLCLLFLVSWTTSAGGTPYTHLSLGCRWLCCASFLGKCSFLLFGHTKHSRPRQQACSGRL